MWFLALVLHDTIWANLRQPPQMQLIWWLVAGYFALDAVLLIRLILHFYRKPATDF
jgi:hypothetical protein